jgi:dolichol-phosphate mannosyltransferase
MPPSSFESSLAAESLAEAPSTPRPKGRACVLSLHRTSVEHDEQSPFVVAILERLRDEGWEVELRNLTLEFEADATDPIHPTYRSVLLERLIPRLNHDVLVVVDDFFEVEPDWFLSAIRTIHDEPVDLVVASRNSRDWFGKIAAIGVERLTGCQAVNASALVVRPSAISHRAPTIKPAGRWVALEMQLRVPRERCSTLPSDPFQRKVRATDARLGKTEVSFLKSYVDYKYGAISRLVQFCIVGFSGMFIDLTSYAGFQAIFGRTTLSLYTVPVLKSSADLAVAGFLAIWLAITWNFLLNRRLTFNDARRNSTLLRQYGTYILSNAVALCVSFALRLWLPAHFDFFDQHKLVAAFVGIVIATGISFNMTRYFVFKSHSRVSE